MPVLWRLVGIVCVAALWSGAALSFFERKRKIVQAFFWVGIAAAALPIVAWFNMYEFIVALVFSGIQITFAVIAFLMAKYSLAAFIN